MSKRIILVRHGESEGNVNRGINGLKPDYALELTEKGISQAQQAGQKIKEIVGNENLFFYISSYWRARSTFEQIARQFPRDQFRYNEEPRLREQEWGHLKPESETINISCERDAYGTFYYRCPDGESGADVYDRISDFFGTLHRDMKKPGFPDNIVIITHGMAIRLFLMRWYHWSVEKFESISNPDNCALVIMERNDSGKFDLKTELKEHEVFHRFQRGISL